MNIFFKAQSFCDILKWNSSIADQIQFVVLLQWSAVVPDVAAVVVVVVVGIFNSTDMIVSFKQFLTHHTVLQPQQF